MTPFMQAANRDPDYVEIYSENVHKWIFPFFLLFSTNFQNAGEMQAVSISDQMKSNFSYEMAES
jgi:hypothetical protein